MKMFNITGLSKIILGTLFFIIFAIDMTYNRNIWSWMWLFNSFIWFFNYLCFDIILNNNNKQ